MPTSDPRALLRRLLEEPNEGAWLEFKHNNCAPELIGRTARQCLSSISEVRSGIARPTIGWTNSRQPIACGLYPKLIPGSDNR